MRLNRLSFLLLISSIEFKDEYKFKRHVRFENE